MRIGSQVIGKKVVDFWVKRGKAVFLFDDGSRLEISAGRIPLHLVFSKDGAVMEE